MSKEAALLAQMKADAEVWHERRSVEMLADDVSGDDSVALQRACDARRQARIRAAKIAEGKLKPGRSRVLFSFNNPPCPQCGDTRRWLRMGACVVCLARAHERKAH